MTISYKDIGLLDWYCSCVPAFVDRYCCKIEIKEYDVIVQKKLEKSNELLSNSNFSQINGYLCIKYFLLCLYPVSTMVFILLETIGDFIYMY